jgi:predicted dehydrogenase
VTTERQQAHSEAVYKMLVGYRAGDMWAPQLDAAEALKTEARHFLDCIAGRAVPMTNGEAGARIVQILEAATLSMAERGRLIELDRMQVTA